MGNYAEVGAVVREFITTRDGYEAEMTVGERVAIAQVAAELILLIESSPGAEPPAETGQSDSLPRFSTGPVAESDDAVIRRLLPDAAPAEPDVSIEFRRLAQGDLIAGKLSRLAELIEKLLGDSDFLASGTAAEREHTRSYELIVSREEAEGFAGALTDVRLALSERIGIRTDEDGTELHENVVAGWEGTQVLDDDAQYLGSIFLLAGFLQESLLTEMLADLRGHGDRRGPSGNP